MVPCPHLIPLCQLPSYHSTSADPTVRRRWPWRSHLSARVTLHKGADAVQAPQRRCARTHARTNALTHEQTHAHARTHARTHTQTHTQSTRTCSHTPRGAECKEEKRTGRGGRVSKRQEEEEWCGMWKRGCQSHPCRRGCRIGVWRQNNRESNLLQGA